MDFKKFLKKIKNTITKTKVKKERVIAKKGDSSFLVNNKTDRSVKTSAKATCHKNTSGLITQSAITTSQLDKAILEAKKIHFSKHNADVTATPLNSTPGSIKHKINVKVNAGLLPLPAGLIAMRDFYSNSINTFPKENKL